MPRRSLLPLLWLCGTICALLTLLFQRAPLAASTDDYALQDSYYVVTNFHFGISLVAWFTLFAAIYWVLDRRLRWEYRYSLGYAHFGLMALGAILLLFPTLLLAQVGLPKRSVDYPEAFASLNRVTVAGYGLGLASLAAFALLLVDAVARRFRRRTGE